MIDVIAYEDIYHNDIKKALKQSGKEDYNSISILDYAENVAINYSSSESDKIAIIYAQGEIQSGEGDINIIGEKSMNRSIKDAREDESVKAIVLRVNSPGGNALTSDLIWREIELTKKIKPVVVSMGNYAASGGYYIACNSNYIFAENTTITGSIGVFGMLPNFNEAANRYGLHTEQVRTNENASNYSPFVPLDPKFKAFMQEGVEQVYSTFVTRVATGRKMSFDQVDAIGQGRVWSGADALKIGLVDKIGNMNDAIKYAAKLSKTNSYSTVDYPEYEKEYKDILKNLPFVQSKAAMIKEEIGEENYLILQNIKKIKARKGIQALMPYQIEVK
jgi:protease-4